MTSDTLLVTFIEGELFEEIEQVETSDLLELLAQRYGDYFPKTGRIYQGEPCAENDITPKTPEQVEGLKSLSGHVHVVIYPGDPTTLIISALAIVAGLATSFLLAPAIPAVNRGAQVSQSPNNALSGRQNRARIGERIPDIYGTVRSTPDLLMEPYKVFVEHVEYEHGYYCVGRGEYEIPAGEIREDATRVLDIDGSTVAVYGPGADPNTDVEQLRVGDAFTETLKVAKRSNSVNGQVLRAPNSGSIAGQDDVRFEDGGIVRLLSSTDIDLANRFEPGDAVTISNATASIDNGTTTVSVNLSGVYEVFSVTSGTLTLVNPAAVNADWSELGNVGGDSVTPYISADIEVDGEFWVGPFTIESDGLNRFYLNFVALNGLYKDDGRKQSRTNVDIEVEITPVDEFGTAIGPVQVETSRVAGSADTRDTRAETARILLDTPGRSRIRVRRTTPIDLDYSGSIVDEVKWRDMYAMSDMPTGGFGEVTTVRSLTEATAGALAVKERRLNMLVTRKIPTRISGDDFTEGLAPQLGDQNLDDLSYWGVVNTGAGWVITPSSLADEVRQLHSVIRTPVNPTFEQGLDSPRLVATPGRAYSAQVWAWAFSGVSLRMSLVWLSGAGAAIASVDSQYLAPTDGETLLTVTGIAPPGAASAVVRLIVSATSGFGVFGAPQAWESGLMPTNRADEIIAAMWLDPMIGRQSAESIDLEQIYATIQEIEAYFGTSKSVEFNHTFDGDDLSIEEMVSSVAEAIFCTAYRSGSKLRLKFERERETASLLFNHRNKVPGSEARTVRFGTDRDHDGVELTYVSPTDDTEATITIPDGSAPANPRKLKTAGIRTVEQANLHANRAWNKLRYQNTAVEFEATQEAELLVRGDRILVADNTRPDTIDGEVIAQVGMVLTLSQHVDITVGSHTIWLQHINGTTESIGVTQSEAGREVTLLSPPALALSVDPNNSARAGFAIAADDSRGVTAFIMTERSPGDRMTSRVQAINYDARYYSNDKDFA